EFADLLDDAEDLAVLPVELAGDLDLVAAAQFAQVFDVLFQHHRPHPAGDQLVLAHPGRAQQLPPGVFGVLQVDGLVQVALRVELVSTDADGDGEGHVLANPGADANVPGRADNRITAVAGTIGVVH